MESSSSRASLTPPCASFLPRKDHMKKCKQALSLSRDQLAVTEERGIIITDVCGRGGSFTLLF